MNKAWWTVLFGAVFEVTWVIGMKYSNNWWETAGTVLAIFLSFYSLIKASEALPVGTAYAVFVGLGSAGTILADTILFGTEIGFGTVFFMLLLLVGIIGLMLAENNEGKGQSK